MYNVREYIRYVKQRVCYAELSLIEISTDEYHFYKYIRDGIIKYVERKSIYPDYWLKGALVKDFMKQHPEVKHERNVFRRLKNEHKQLEDLILHLEKVGGKIWKQ